VAFAYFLVSGWSNAVNLTDGLDGLAAGSSIMVFGAYVAIGFWQFRNSCVPAARPGPVLRGARPARHRPGRGRAMGACFGFLWWNASPAKIFMGDTGSLAIGGAFAGPGHRHPHRAAARRARRAVRHRDAVGDPADRRLQAHQKRLFNMAPIHHHFELAGWVENTVIVRFWIISGLAVAFGLGTFYAEYLSQGPLR
jgi:phospho-N-acetylmuramoyl-pentapeptide-transferase